MYRGAIYFFYDGAGIVDDYIPVLLEDLCKNLNELVVVCNGKLSDEGRAKLERFTKDIIVRPNEGLDVWAYITGLRHFGWDKLDRFDEIVLLNHTIMGPVYPFKETFDKMEAQDVDFWGITRHFQCEDPYKKNKYGYYPDHIQSHFMVYRKKLITSKEFHDYWEGFPEQMGYMESINQHESYFTKYFGDMGYKWALSVEDEDLRPVSDYPGMYCAREMVENRRCPIFKRRGFFHDYGQFLETTAGESVRELYDFLEESGLYDMDLVWQNLFRSMNMTDVEKNLHLNYTLPTQGVVERKKIKCDRSKYQCLPGSFTYDGPARKKSVLLAHIYYLDELPYMQKYMRNIPADMDIVVTTQTEEKKAEILKAFEGWKNNVQVRLVENRGRDVQALMTTGRELVDQYEYICFIHDKKVTQDKPGTVGAGFKYICYENALSSPAYVQNVLNLLESDDRLGVLCPPCPKHGPYLAVISMEWAVNYEGVKALLERLGVKAPIDKLKAPVAPHGSIFWFRSDAVRKLFKYDWKPEDFAEEPMPIDGTISHAIERVYSFVAQEAGYYTAYLMSDKYAATEYDTMYKYTEIYSALGNNSALAGARVWQNTSAEARLRVWMRRLLPKKLFTYLINWKRKRFGPHIAYNYDQG